jgi:hypothetical protein
VIRTTAEHPFRFVGRGWIAAQQIVPRDLLLGAGNEQAAVNLLDEPKEFGAGLQLGDRGVPYVPRWECAVGVRGAGASFGLSQGVQANKKGGCGPR